MFTVGDRRRTGLEGVFSRFGNPVRVAIVSWNVAFIKWS